MNDSINLRDWCERERAWLQKTLDLMIEGKFKTHENRNGAIVDTSSETMGTIKSAMADLDRLLTKQ